MAALGIAETAFRSALVCTASYRTMVHIALRQRTAIIGKSSAYWGQSIANLGRHILPKTLIYLITNHFVLSTQGMDWKCWGIGVKKC